MRKYRKHKHQKRNELGQLITKSGKVDRRGVKLSDDERARRGAFLTYRRHAKRVGAAAGEAMTRYEFELAADRSGQDFSSKEDAIEFGYQQAANIVGQLTPKQAKGAAATILDVGASHPEIYERMIASSDLRFSLLGKTAQEKIESLKKMIRDGKSMLDAKNNGLVSAFYQAMKDAGMSAGEAAKKMAELFGSD